MATNVDPPVLLDPSQDTGHQLAFINQNFQALTSAVNKTGFVIVGSGTTSITGPAIAYNNNISQGLASTTITHNLGFIPIVLAYYYGGSTYFSLPNSTMSNPITNVRGNYVFTNYNWESTTTTVRFFENTTISDSGAGTYTGADITIKYYLLQQTAN